MFTWQTQLANNSHGSSKTTPTIQSLIQKLLTCLPGRRSWQTITMVQYSSEITYDLCARNRSVQRTQEERLRTDHISKRTTRAKLIKSTLIHIIVKRHVRSIAKRSRDTTERTILHGARSILRERKVSYF